MEDTNNSLEGRFDKLFPKSSTNNGNLWGTRGEYLAFIKEEITRAKRQVVESLDTSWGDYSEDELIAWKEKQLNQDN